MAADRRGPFFAKREVMKRMTCLKRNLLAPALIALGSLVAATAVGANPQTVDYRCTPPLPKGDTVTIDYNSGYKSITMQLPNGQSVRLPRKRSASGIRFAGSAFEVRAKGQKDLSLTIRGEPSRQCVSQAP
jgi:membrane-bound inhibitor of C-type lysozyme